MARRARALTAWVTRDCYTQSDYTVHLRKPKSYNDTVWIDGTRDRPGHYADRPVWSSRALLYEVCEKYWELTGGVKLKLGACKRMRIKLTCKAVK